MKALPTLALLALLLASCGDAPTPPAGALPRPEGAQFAPEQIAEAKKHGVPVTFENELGMRFVLIPAGTFRMGSPEDEAGRNCYETQHEVTLTRPFYMQTTEVTNAQYRALVEEHQSGAYEGHALDGASQPVVRVIWEEAVAYASKLAARDTRRSYRLPTDAEWERAARAGTHTRFHFGDTVDAEAKNANGLDIWAIEATNAWGSDTWPQTDGYIVSAPVASFAPNPWGIYDTAGNVWEWCSDFHGDIPDQSVSDPTGPPDGRTRVMRGGSYDSGEDRLRSAARAGMYAWARQPHIGFRLVSPLPEAAE